MPTLTNVMLHSDFGIPTSSTIPSLRKQPTFRKTPALVFESLFDAKAFKSISVEVALVFPRKWHLMWCHYPDLGPACFWLVENLLHPIRSNQKCYPNLGSDTSSVWSFCARFSDVIWRGNQWWLRQMSAVFSGYYYPQPVESRTNKHFFWALLEMFQKLQTRKRRHANHLFFPVFITHTRLGNNGQFKF